MTHEQAKAHDEAKAELAAMKAAGQIESYNLIRNDPDHLAPYYCVGVKVGGEWEFPLPVTGNYFAELDEAMEGMRRFVAGRNRQPMSDELRDVLTCHDSEGM
jgi:hypothetical protein